jgi:hypothetical protein
MKFLLIDGNNIGIDDATKVYDTDGKYKATFIAVNIAIARAIGYDPGSTVDGTIQFSSDFKFDLDPRNGVLALTWDFHAVASYEIGHVLGFVSGVDDYDFVGTGGPLADEVCFAGGATCSDYPDVQNDWWSATLDMFRYSEDGKLDWTTGKSSYFSADGGTTTYQSGMFSTGDFNRDGWQASPLEGTATRQWQLQLRDAKARPAQSVYLRRPCRHCQRAKSRELWYHRLQHHRRRSDDLFAFHGADRL